MPSRSGGTSGPQAWPVLLEAFGLFLVSLVWIQVVSAPLLDLEALPIYTPEVRHLRFSFKTFPDVWEILQPPYPPLTYLFTCFFYKVGGITPAMAFLSISVLTALIAPASYLLARVLFGRPAGVVAFFLAGTSSLLISHSNFYLTEQMVALWTPLFLAAWFASKGHTRPWWSGLSGVLLGLGLLSKPTFVFFVFPVLLEGFWRLIRTKGPGPDLSRTSGPLGKRSGPSIPPGVWGLACLAIPAGISLLTWSTMAHGGGRLALLAGELLIQTTIVWSIGRLGNRTGMEERRFFGNVLFVFLTLAVAGPYYAAAGQAISDLFAGYSRWMEMGIYSWWRFDIQRFDIWTFDRPLVPYEKFLVPLGLLGVFKLPRPERRYPLMALACLVCGVGWLLLFCLGEGPGNSRFLIPAIPLAAALAGGISRLFSPSLAPLAAVLLTTLLLQQQSPDQWRDLRFQKTTFLFFVDQSPVPTVLLRRLQARAFRKDAVCMIPCRSERAWKKFMERLGYDRKFWFFVDGLACLRILEPVELESLARDGGPPEEAELVLLGGRSEQEEADLAREVEGILGVRLEKVESLGDRRCRFTISRIRR